MEIKTGQFYYLRTDSFIEPITEVERQLFYELRNTDIIRLVKVSKIEDMEISIDDSVRMVYLERHPSFDKFFKHSPVFFNPIPLELFENCIDIEDSEALDGNIK